MVNTKEIANEILKEIAYELEKESNLEKVPANWLELVKACENPEYQPEMTSDPQKVRAWNKLFDKVN